MRYLALRDYGVAPTCEPIVKNLQGFSATLSKKKSLRIDLAKVCAAVTGYDCSCETISCFCFSPVLSCLKKL
jgi:hypothetical protein